MENVTKCNKQAWWKQISEQRFERFRISLASCCSSFVLELDYADCNLWHFVQIYPKHLPDTQKSVVFYCYIIVYPHSKIPYRHAVIRRVFDCDFSMNKKVFYKQKKALYQGL